MTICPSVARRANAADESSLMLLLRQMHEEVGLFPYAESNVAALVRPVLAGTVMPVPTIIGVIGPSDDIQASICVMASRIYYTDEWHLGDLWSFVRQDSRKSNHAKALIDFSKGCADRLGLSLISGVVSTVRTESKMRLYRRRFGQCVGGFFLYHPKLDRAS